MLLFFATMLYYLSNFYPQYSFAFTGVMIIVVSLAGFVLIWPMTLEGSVFVSRFFGGENIGIDIMVEPGNFGIFKSVNMSKPDFEKAGEEEHYKTSRDALIQRRGLGVPYLIHISGKAEAVNLIEAKTGIDAGENTAYMNRFKALVRAKLFNEQFRQFFLLLIGGIAATAIVGAVLYWSLSDLTSINANLLARADYIIAHIPSASPVPGAIPKV